VKSRKNKFSRLLTFKVRLQKNSVFKRELVCGAKYGDHKQEKLVGGSLFLLTYFLIDILRWPNTEVSS
jgi:hypothetical protein